jgi:hypothetical protein
LNIGLFIKKKLDFLFIKKNSIEYLLVWYSYHRFMNSLKKYVLD